MYQFLHSYDFTIVYKSNVRVIFPNRATMSEFLGETFISVNAYHMCVASCHCK